MGGDPAEKGGIFLEGSLDYAQQIGVPILSADEWLEFTELRHESNFENVIWNLTASALTFDLLPPNQPDTTLTVLIPLTHADKSLSSVQVDGVTISMDSRLVLGGAEYAQIIVSAQEHNLKVTYS
jgi:hypothetical protein